MKNDSTANLKHSKHFFQNQGQVEQGLGCAKIACFVSLKLCDVNKSIIKPNRRLISEEEEEGWDNIIRGVNATNWTEAYHLNFSACIQIPLSLVGLN